MAFWNFIKKYGIIIALALMIIVSVSLATVNEMSSPDFNREPVSYIALTALKTLPTIITLIVMMLVAHAKRSAFLLGGCNAALYGISYILSGVYFSAISALLISAPIQISTYFSWKKNSDGDKVRFKFMKPWQLILTLGIILGGWAFSYFVLSGFMEGQNFPVLDTLVFALGTVITVIIVFRFVESQYLNTVSCIIGLIMWIMLTLKDPTNINQVIISTYNLFRVVQAAVNWTRQYIREKKARVGET